MSRFPMLKSALVAALALSNVNGLCCPVDQDENRVEQLRKGELAAELTACLADDLACETLCREVLVTRGFVFDTGLEPQFSRCIVVASEDPLRPVVHMTYTIPQDCVGGRRPAGEASAQQCANDPVAAYLVGIAHLEAISVHAFLELARDLQEHGAPEHLWRRALAAAADEVEHAGAVARLAGERGATLKVPTVSRRVTRPLFDVAQTNAVQGCVRELYGAVVAMWQGREAADATVRAVFATIAKDELRHAELSFAIDHWARTVLSPAEMLLIDRARQDACNQLASSEVSPGVARELGLPSLASAQSLAASVSAVSFATVSS